MKIFQVFEKWVVIALLILMMAAVLASAIELAIILIQELMKPPLLLLDISEMLEVFGFFLMVLIGLELLESIRAYLYRHRFHVEVVILVAMVAVGRKIIILDYKQLGLDLLLGMAAIIVALGISFYLIRKSYKEMACGTPPLIDTDADSRRSQERPERTP